MRRTPAETSNYETIGLDMLGRIAALPTREGVMSSRPRYVRHALSVLVLVCAGCTNSPIVHGAKSVADALAQLQKAARSFRDPQQTRDLTTAIDRFQSMEHNPKGVFASPHLTQVLEGMTPKDFEHFVFDLEPHPDPVARALDFPSPQRTALVLASYKAQAKLLEEARDDIQRTGDDSIDEYPIAKIVYVPPQTDMPPEINNAAAYFEVGNQTGFTAYNPSFRIRVDTPQGQNVLDRTFQIDQQDQDSALAAQGPADAPAPGLRTSPVRAARGSDLITVPAGSKTLFRWTCCNVLHEPMLNALLLHAGNSVVVRIDPVTMKQRNGSDALKTDGFDADDSRRLVKTRLCIVEIEGNVSTWRPKPDSPCRDAGSSQALLAGNGP